MALIFFLFGLTLDVSAKDAVIYRNRAVFGIEKNFFFTSDLNTQKQDLASIHCLFKDSSFILKALDFKEFQQDIPIQREKGLKNYRPLIDKFVLLNKLLLFSNTNNASQKLPQKTTKCFKKPPEYWTSFQKRLYTLEISLQERFQTPSTSQNLKDFVASLDGMLTHEYFF